MSSRSTGIENVTKTLVGSVGNCAVPLWHSLAASEGHDSDEGERTVGCNGWLWRAHTHTHTHTHTYVHAHTHTQIQTRTHRGTDTAYNRRQAIVFVIFSFLSDRPPLSQLTSSELTWKIKPHCVCQRRHFTINW